MGKNVTHIFNLQKLCYNPSQDNLRGKKVRVSYALRNSYFNAEKEKKEEL